MRTLTKSPLILITAIAAMAESAYGTQPPEVVASDSVFNTAMGTSALLQLTTGSENSATGFRALYSNVNHHYNTVVGYPALYKANANYNVAVGHQAGYSLTRGTNNIDIGNLGVTGESGPIRIGIDPTQTATYIAGLDNTSVTGKAVVISSTGQLGVALSSERSKTAIAPMDSTSGELQQLRPVTFHIKTDPQGPLRYGWVWLAITIG
jgi:hypothetical protein